MKAQMIGALVLGVLAVAASAQEPFVGNTLITPLRSTETFLIDMNHTTLQAWHGDNGAGHTVYLLPDGSVLRGQGDPNAPIRGGGGSGGHLQRIDAKDNVVWDYFFSNTEHQHHHDIEPMPNGNVLVIAWERKTREEAIAAGRTAPFGSELLPTLLVELEPVATNDAKIVWEWRIWDHIIQDTDPRKPSYGVIENHPERVDVNQGGAGVSWDHANYVDYEPRSDQILLCARAMNEIFVIDHSTTSQEAAGHSGGNSGKGGDILYRWGNPRNYRRGTEDDQYFHGVHGANWINAGLPGSGGILAFNNGNRPGDQNDRSSVVEIHPPRDDDGYYLIAEGEPFGPAIPTWEYEKGPTFYSLRYGSAYRQPNGNTLICEGEKGFIFEVAPDGTTVWTYIEPIGRGVFAAQRYWTLPDGVAILDIKPGSCPNPFNIKLFEETANTKSRKGGVLPVALLGSGQFDVRSVEVASLRLEGVSAVGSSFEDVGGPFPGAGCECTDAGPDGFTDLTLKFIARDIAENMSPGEPGEERVLKLTGTLIDGTFLEATDCVVFVSGRPMTVTVDPPPGPVLSAAFPNPFNPVTRIGFSMPREDRAILSVYDVKGRLVATLIDKVVSAGNHHAIWDAGDNPSGLYFYQITVGDFTAAGKLILLK